MEIYLKPIISACYVFPVLAVLFTLPYIIYEYHKYGSILVIRTGVVYTFIFYMITSYFMTVLPLPPIDSVTPDSACMLLGQNSNHTHFGIDYSEYTGCEDEYK